MLLYRTTKTKVKQVIAGYFCSELVWTIIGKFASCRLIGFDSWLLSSCSKNEECWKFTKVRLLSLYGSESSWKNSLWGEQYTFPFALMKKPHYMRLAVWANPCHWRMIHITCCPRPAREPKPRDLILTITGDSTGCTGLKKMLKSNKILCSFVFLSNGLHSYFITQKHITEEIKI